MKCPVCKSNCKKSDKKCPTCGFTELNVEFINLEEAEAWERSVLRPCRALWNATQSMYEVALKRVQEIAEQESVGESDGQASITISSSSTSPSTKKRRGSKDKIIYEDAYVRVEYTGVELSEYGKLYIKCIAENKSTKNLYISMEKATCNGWDVTYYSNEGVVHVSAGSKCKSAFDFSKFSEKSDIKSLDEIEEFRYKIKVVDTDSYKTLSEPSKFFYLDALIKK